MMPSFGPPEHSRGGRTIVFDGAYIRDELLPRLTARYVNAERYGVRISSDEGSVFTKNDFKTQVTTRMFFVPARLFQRPCAGPGARAVADRHGWRAALP